jgi:hypothetical protein
MGGGDRGPALSGLSPSKSIRTQIEQASALPEGYAGRAKLVYQMAEQHAWSPQKTMEMLRDPTKFARYAEIVSAHSVKSDFI